MASKRQYRKKPFAIFEHGTRIYAPSAAYGGYRVVAKDPSGRRLFLTFDSEADARAKAREVEAYIAAGASMRSADNDHRTVGVLVDRYLEHISTKSARYQERQDSLLRNWVLPILGDTLVPDWTPAASDEVLARARARLAPATVQSLGSSMRSLVTHAHKSRWLPRDVDPMWRVSYSAKAEFQAQAVGFIAREALPTEEECALLFEAMVSQGHHVWALAMRLKQRSGVRWGELIALRPIDVEFEPNRVVRVHRAVEQTKSARSIKSTKNEHKRSTFFPASLTADLRAHVEDVRRNAGPDSLLFPGRDGGPANRVTFRRAWVRAARAAGWPMNSPTAARWHPHDLRHVAACWMLFDVRIDPAIVSVMLGHANPAFTLSRYVGVRGHAESQVTALTVDW